MALKPCAAASRRAFQLYNTALLPLTPLVTLYTLWRRYGQQRSAASLRGMAGHVPRDAVRALRPAEGGLCIWIHAVSVGESVAARPVARALRMALPNCKIGFSVTTDTGYETAAAAVRAGEADAVFYFPLDLPSRVRRALNAVRPDVFITMETELWPNFLHLAHQRGVRTFLVNGRVSDNLLKTWPRLGWVWRWMMGNLDAALMRSDYDAQRLARLPGQPQRVLVVGDVKLDSLASPVADSDARSAWRGQLAVADGAPFWVAGSTHPGEEDKVLCSFATLRRDMPALRLLLAPRHVERVAEVEQAVRDHGLKPERRTRLNQTTRSEDAIIVLDTVGELAQVYAAADVAFVGGSLIERGGHNLLEPVLRGVPVVFGPHVANFREAAALAQRAGVGTQVEDETELADAVRHWLTDRTGTEQITRRAAMALAAHQGAAARVARIVVDAVGAGDGCLPGE